MAGYVHRQVSTEQSVSFHLVVTPTGKIEHLLYAKVTPYSEFGFAFVYHLDLHRRKEVSTVNMMLVLCVLFMAERSFFGKLQ
jgi:hypothetical protein